ncbi:hypothetical protein H8N03_19250 [Ramlibacter sp. USB13]|uniref:Flagella basal body P-ring formation protein FlgA n=1 Tax=Ramlibacter cellulosilyticus TaxID=2764187 RepID=A0A923MWM5_9BURK|nr:hypothetical protein [Ramlibacter cellulosilyticus]MBC5785092.1 hypothetical protein [Ramlibacter cellulosilyticus]
MRATTLLLACLASPVAWAGPQAGIELLPRATVASSQVVLGDVARVHAQDLATIRTLVNLPVGRAPRPGESAALRRTDLAQWVRRHTDLAPDALDWSGAHEARVVRATPRVKGEEIARAAVEAARGGHVLVGGTPRDVDVPEGRVRLEVRGLEQGASAGRMLVWVDVWTEGAFVRTVPVSLQSAAAATAATGERTLRDDALLATGDAGPLAVARGEWASLRSVEGSITLESRVEVLQDGRPGQRIRVRPQGASGPMFARVLGPGRVELAP